MFYQSLPHCAKQNSLWIKILESIPMLLWSFARKDFPTAFFFFFYKFIIRQYFSIMLTLLSHQFVSVTKYMLPFNIWNEFALKV